jgi:hypothetical protein
MEFTGGLVCVVSIVSGHRKIPLEEQVLTAAIKQNLIVLLIYGYKQWTI